MHDFELPEPQTFTDLFECVNYIMQYSHYPLHPDLYLNELVLDTGEVIRDMKLHRYSFELDRETFEPSLNTIELSSEGLYDSINIDKYFKKVTHRNSYLGLVVSISLTVSIRNLCTGYQEKGGDYTMPSIFF